MPTINRGGARREASGGVRQPRQVGGQTGGRPASLLRHPHPPRCARATAMSAAGGRTSSSVSGKIQPSTGIGPLDPRSSCCAATRRTRPVGCAPMPRPRPSWSFRPARVRATAIPARWADAGANGLLRPAGRAGWMVGRPRSRSASPPSDWGPVGSVGGAGHRAAGPCELREGIASSRSRSPGSRSAKAQPRHLSAKARAWASSWTGPIGGSTSNSRTAWSSRGSNAISPVAHGPGEARTARPQPDQRARLLVEHRGRLCPGASSDPSGDREYQLIDLGAVQLCVTCRAIDDRVVYGPSSGTTLPKRSSSRVR